MAGVRVYDFGQLLADVPRAANYFPAQNTDLKPLI